MNRELQHRVMRRYIAHTRGYYCKPMRVCPRCGVRDLPPYTGGHITRYVPRRTVQTSKGVVRYQLRVCDVCHDHEVLECEVFGDMHDGDLANWAIMRWRAHDSATLTDGIGILPR